MILYPLKILLRNEAMLKLRKLITSQICSKNEHKRPKEEELNRIIT